MSSDFSEDYQLLGVACGASRSEIKQAYRRLEEARAADSNRLSQDEFTRVQAAYERLMEQAPPSAFVVSDEAGDREVNGRSRCPEVPWGPFGAILVTIGGFLGVDILTLLVTAGIYASLHSLDFSGALATFGEDFWWLVAYLATARLGAVALIYRYVRHRGGNWRSLGFRAFSGVRATAAITTGIIGFFAVSALLTLGLEQFAPQVDITAEQELPFLEAATAVEMALAFLAIVIIAPAVEEVVFRGFLLPAFAHKTGAVAAVVLVSVAFGALHFPPAIAAIQIGVFSVFLCSAYLFTRSVWPPIMLHALKNLIAFYFLFIFNTEQLVLVTAPLWSMIATIM